MPKMKVSIHTDWLLAVHQATYFGVILYKVEYWLKPINEALSSSVGNFSSIWCLRNGCPPNTNNFLKVPWCNPWHSKRIWKLKEKAYTRLFKSLGLRPFPSLDSLIGSSRKVTFLCLCLKIQWWPTCLCCFPGFLCCYFFLSFLCVFV